MKRINERKQHKQTNALSFKMELFVEKQGSSSKNNK